jgi:hypothetical protein
METIIHSYKEVLGDVMLVVKEYVITRNKKKEFWFKKRQQYSSHQIQ